MLQVPSSLPPYVPPLGAISAATRVANAEAKGTMMLLTNFVLIIVVFLSLF
jgi:hypothetical protein